VACKHLLCEQLLYALQLYALSPALPHVSRHLYEVYKSAPSSFHAEYILGRALAHTGSKSTGIITRALRYPLCTRDVLDALCRLAEAQAYGEALKNDVAELPRRLFDGLAPKYGPVHGSGLVEKVGWTVQDEPLPFLRHLYKLRWVRAPDTNAHDGYALTRAVQAGFVQLVRFLLARGADPGRRGGLALWATIRRGDLELLKMLIERDGWDGGKRRRVEDRVQVGSEMVRAAVKSDARDIVEYLMEKGCVPDIPTLRMVAKMGVKVRGRR